MYIEKLVEIFSEVKRVLRNDGTLWIVIGDSYAGSGKAGSNPEYQKKHTQFGQTERKERFGIPQSAKKIGLKPKDLIGIPWMLAFALRNDGWYLRKEIIWNKNAMPESVKDRPTNSHENIFLLAKSGSASFWVHRDLTLKDRVYKKPDPDYRWIHKETKEELSTDPQDKENYKRINLWRGNDYYYDYNSILEVATGYDGRKDTFFKGSKKYKDSTHTFHKRGHGRWHNKITGKTGDGHSGYFDAEGKPRFYLSNDIPARNKRSVWNVNTESFKGAHFAVFPQLLIKDCIKAGCPEGGIILDPFAGSNTTGIVARKQNKNYISIELNPEYIDLAKKRMREELGIWE